MINFYFFFLIFSLNKPRFGCESFSVKSHAKFAFDGGSTDITRKFKLGGWFGGGIYFLKVRSIATTESNFNLYSTVWPPEGRGIREKRYDSNSGIRSKVANDIRLFSLFIIWISVMVGSTTRLLERVCLACF